MTVAERVSCLEAVLSLAEVIAAHPLADQDLWMRAMLLSLDCRATLNEIDGR